MKFKPINHLTHDEVLLLRVVKRSIKYARTSEELDDVNKCLDYLLKTAIERFVKERDDKHEG